MQKLDAIYIAFEKDAGLLENISTPIKLNYNKLKDSVLAKKISEPIKLNYNKLRDAEIKTYVKATNNPITRKIDSIIRKPYNRVLFKGLGENLRHLSSPSNIIGNGGIFGGAGASGLW